MTYIEIIKTIASMVIVIPMAINTIKTFKGDKK